MVLYDVWEIVAVGFVIDSKRRINSRTLRHPFESNLCAKLLNNSSQRRISFVGDDCEFWNIMEMYELELKKY